MQIQQWGRMAVTWTETTLTRVIKSKNQTTVAEERMESEEEDGTRDTKRVKKLICEGTERGMVEAGWVCAVKSDRSLSLFQVGTD